MYIQISIKRKDDSVKILSISELKERVTRDLKWEEGYDWNESLEDIQKEEEKVEKEEGGEGRKLEEKKKYQ